MDRFFPALRSAAARTKMRPMLRPAEIARLQYASVALPRAKGWEFRQRSGSDDRSGKANAGLFLREPDDLSDRPEAATAHCLRWNLSLFSPNSTPEIMPNSPYTCV